MTQNLLLALVLSPLFGCLIAGFLGRQIGRRNAHRVAIAGVAVAFALSVYVLKLVLVDGQYFNATIYHWLQAGSLSIEVGFMVDALTAVMMVVVTFVSFMVHIYTIGYMHEDPGYCRFFSYLSLFTFAMLMLVMANNFMQLFFGWEAVGLVSYLLIGFWYKKPTAIYANLKAFLVNRVGDFGFLLGIGAVLMYSGSLNYLEVFAQAPALAERHITIWGDQSWSLMTVIGILLFIGAMGKSAQVPLHVWLPDSMEGPTPISALIHAATMVTAGIFMVARMSPLYAYSETALAFIVIIGAITALFMGFLGLIQNDIKRVIAYSTLSQLGYMTVALGVSAYSAAIFHLFTHAFFKALLFLAAGSVILAMHHQQDIRQMGGLRKYLPITYWTSVIGTLALIGAPGLAGFFSKDAIIEAVHASAMPGAGFAYWALLIGVFVTALYSFRLLFLVFHGQSRFDAHGHPPHESPVVVTVPLILLAIPSIFAGYLIGQMVFGDWLRDAIVVSPQTDVLNMLGYHGVWAFLWHGLQMPPFWLALAGVVTAWFLYIRRPDLPARLQHWGRWLWRILDNKYGFDHFNEKVFAGGARGLGSLLWQLGDKRLIDGVLVNGSARLIGLAARFGRHVQSGYLYHYAFVMMIGVWLLLSWFVL
ncbi:NADH-ubiquinone oxidoreductase chain L [Methylophaga frappieri]|uniref:NADH-ubiquinone oxidoreductase chain L n=1 Tax=Methylophaga frappieri (strain ATCC BAA-2434 / DSM 25690 / JAM7) TaxID=754477 RepID=I1YHF8_METFJ|nr:NADH-quinone oxidoreductase subunit L [Methylophaga frappieri]AFJ02351.1 NADH-ubiquinone oxidoreductase chain L [Methylophaga frappieri]